MFKGLINNGGFKRVKKGQVVPVTAQTAGWLCLDEEGSSSPGPEGSAENAIDVNILDFMGLDEFLALMKSKTDSNYDALWCASKQLAMQVKSSKSLLALNSQLCAGKSKTEVLNDVVESMKFSLNAHHVVILEYAVCDDSLHVTYTDTISCANLTIPVSGSKHTVERDVYQSGSCINMNVVDQPTYVDPMDELTQFKTEHILCAPIIVDNEVLGVVKISRGVELSEVSPRISDLQGRRLIPFGDQDESMITFTAANIGFVLKYVAANGDKEHERMRAKPDASLTAGMTSIIRKSKELLAVSRHSPNSSLTSAKSDEGQLAVLGSSPGSVDSIINWLVAQLYDEVECDRISVFMISEDKTNLDCVLSRDMVGVSLPVKSGILGSTFRTGQVHNVVDVRLDERFYSLIDEQTNYKTENILSIPMLEKNNVLGVVQLANKRGGPFTQVDQNRAVDIVKCISALFQVKLDVLEYAVEKELGYVLSNSMRQMLSTESFSEMLAVAKYNLRCMLDVNYVECFEFENNGEFLGMRKVIGRTVPSKNGGAAANNIDEEYALTKIPKVVLDCIRTGDTSTYASDNANDDPELLPGLKAKYAVIYPVGSKVFAGSPSKYIMVVARTESNKRFLPAERHVAKVFMDVLGSVVSTFERARGHDLMILQKDWELNMIINTLKLMHNYVMLLDENGFVVACNRDMEGIVGTKHKVMSHFSKWFDENQQMLSEDIQSVLDKGRGIFRDVIEFKNSKSSRGRLLSYQVCPVGSAGEVYGESDNVVSKSELKAVIVVLHLHSETAAGAKRVRDVLVSKAHRVDEGRTDTIQGTMSAVTQAICEIGGRFNLTYTEQKALNMIAANVMQVGRNLRASMSSSELSKQVDKVVTGSISTIAEEVQSGETEPPKFDANAPEKIVLVCDEAYQIDDLFTWEFDVNKYKSKATLRGILGRLYETMLNLSEIQVNSKTLASFLREAEKHYHNNPFHNFYHITCVTHFSYMLINATNGKHLLSNNMYYIFAILLSATVHDIDHPGNSNLFEINSKSELALLYNEQSVLENHHCSMAFRIMRYHNTDVLENLPAAAYKDVKKAVINSILATDMSVHFELIDKIKKKVNEGWNLTDVNDVLFYCRIMLHAADLSNPVRPFHLAKLWSQRISDEFNQQVEKEKRLGLPVLGFMITPDTKTLYKNEMGFASFVVAPMWRNLEVLFPSFKPIIAQLNSNLEQYKRLLDEINEKESIANE